VGQLEALKAVAALGILADDIENGVNELSTLGVVSLGPVVTSSSLAENKVVGAEDLAVRSGANGVHGAGLEIHQDGAGNIAPTSGFVEVNVDALQLNIAVAVVGTGGVNTVLVADNLPELGSDLVSALASLHVNNLAHGVCCSFLVDHYEPISLSNTGLAPILACRPRAAATPTTAQRRRQGQPACSCRRLEDAPARAHS
jgi:hypothetical protein